MTIQIDATRRPVEFLVKTFVDTYEMWVDDKDNFRLIHIETDRYSLWTMHNGIAVLNDRFVLSKFWQGILPVETLMLWQPLRSL